ncbi:WD40 repeat-like protein [Gonapodya prolifera JEL478]|uniref:WD40 repeat-like protein n=1 Tax=Gonapodya prolifera (strain JEL478) TaxID=1344416 RepID=A0A139A7I8_GONPJ|nr:WD40 repeat-like protein [Gonapodya prolifera JEL478]|eukprot:KXS12333.1 WD40 repeat-like protein [Gonapodya prolifera JEL478]
MSGVPDKRKADNDAGTSSSYSTTSLVKRPRTDDPNDAAALILSGQSAAAATGALSRTVKRTSALAAPIMLLTGHGGELFTAKFSPDGQSVVSGSFDKSIFLWKTYGDCSNYAVLKGHKSAVIEVQWGREGDVVYSVSADKSMCQWDVPTQTRLRKHVGHTDIVNTCAVSRKGREQLATGGDDCSVKIWDPREKQAVYTISEKWQVTALEWSADGQNLFVGGLDNQIKAYDLRRPEPLYTLSGHMDTITGLRISPDGSRLLSNGMDNTVRTWDVRPFAPGSRLVGVYEGAPHGFEKYLIRPCWSSDGAFVAAGAADRTVLVWNVDTRKIVYKLPGHKGVVTEVGWHPKEPIVLSCSTDKTMYLGEVNPDEVRF